MSSDRPAVVIDNGTGYTKMGFAGNCEPQYIVPTLVATKADTGKSKASANLDDLDYYIGNEVRGHRVV